MPTLQRALQATLQMSLADRRRLQAHKSEGENGGEDGKANYAYSNTAGSAAGFRQGTSSNPGLINELDQLNIEAKEDLENDRQDMNGVYKNQKMAKKKKVLDSQE